MIFLIKLFDLNREFD